MTYEFNTKQIQLCADSESFSFNLLKLSMVQQTVDYYHLNN